MEHVFNAVYTVLGGLISGLVGWFLESRRRKNDAMLKHFDDIKNECLEPLKRELVDLCARFGYVEGHLPTHEVLDIVREEKVSVPSEDPRYWANYSFGNICNKVLYDDLVNHFPSLSKALAELEEEVRAGVPELFKALRALYTLIHSDEEFVQLKTQLEKLQLAPELVYFIFLVAIGVEESRWPLTYRETNRQVVDRIVKVGEKFRGSREAKIVHEISESVLTKAKHCLNEVEKIRLQKKLKGKCPYV
ncbi:MAG: hypothetical protein QXM43_01600 [Desulfurococcaceae archaeon]